MFYKFTCTKCDISDFKVSQGNTATYLRGDGKTDMSFVGNLLLFAAAKEFCKSSFSSSSSSSSSSSFYLPEKLCRLQYNKVKHGMTTRQEDCAYSCHLLKPTKTKQQLRQNYLQKLSVTNKNCSDHNDNRSSKFS